MAALARALAPATIANDLHLEDLAAELASRRKAERASDVSDDEMDSQTKAGRGVVEDMLRVRANGLAGLKAKASAAVWCMGDEKSLHHDHAIEPGTTYDQIGYSIISDLLALPTATVHPFPAPAEAARLTVSPIQRAAAEFVACKADHDEAYARLLVADEAAKALLPTPPQIIQDWQRPGQALSRIQLAQHDVGAAQVTWPKPKGSPRVEAFDHWRAQVEAIESSFGVPGLDDAMERAGAAEDQAARRVANTKAETIQDAVVKYAVLLASWGDKKRDEIISASVFFDFLGDLEHIAQSAR